MQLTLKLDWDSGSSPADFQGYYSALRWFMIILRNSCTKWAFDADL